MIVVKAIAGLALLLASPALAEPVPPEAAASPAPAELPANLPKSVAKALAKADGQTRETAIKVRSVGQEYEIIRALGYAPQVQSLVMEGGKTYDRLDVVHAKTGDKRSFW
ncbi:MAG: hypothetical protein ACREBO_08820, partial [Novosphingobium sp.]